MIKIEKIDAVNATVARNGIKQALLTGSKLSEEELASITADTGTVLYSIDEREVKTLIFQKAGASDGISFKLTQPATKPVIKQPAPRAAKATKPE